MLAKITKEIVSKVPDKIRMTQKEMDVLKSSKNFVLERLDFITKEFYDIVFNCEKTKNIFHEGERPFREKSFKHWVEQTLSRDINDEYWEWQTYVGLIHIKRGVGNDIFINMLNFVTELLVVEIVTHLPPETAIPILKSWLKLSSLVTSLITEGYRLFYHKAVENVTGLNENILKNIVKVEIDNLVAENQKYRIK